MTVYDALNMAQDLRPSEVSRTLMLQWLNALDGQLWTEIIRKYIPDDDTPATMPVYTATDDVQAAGTVLLVPAPYDQIYLDYLVMRTDLINADFERYNNDAVMFQEQYQTFINWYNRNHTYAAGKTEDGVYYNWAISF